MYVPFLNSKWVIPDIRRQHIFSSSAFHRVVASSGFLGTRL